MAQLRDAQTSQLICDGSPADIARVAAGFDGRDVLFDDVGRFDPVAVRRLQDDEIRLLEDEVARPGAPDELRARVKYCRDARAAAVGRQGEARERMEAARARSDRQR